MPPLAPLFQAVPAPTELTLSEGFRAKHATWATGFSRESWRFFNKKNNCLRCMQCRVPYDHAGLKVTNLPNSVHCFGDVGVKELTFGQ